MNLKMYTKPGHPTYTYLVTKTKKMVLGIIESYADTHANILSMGCGNCVHEAILSNSLNRRIYCVDKDYLIEKNVWCNPHLIVASFDFKNHHTLCEFLDAHFPQIDLAYFMDSSYVLTNKEYTLLLQELRAYGVRLVIDATTAYISPLSIPRVLLGNVKQRLLRYQQSGYTRTKRQLKQIFKRAGWTVVRDIDIELDMNMYVVVAKT